MKRVVSAVQAVALAATAVFVVMLFANEPGDAKPPRASGSAGRQQAAPAAVDGDALYSSRCASCHGQDGEGGIGPQLSGRVEQRFPDVDDQVAVVAGGRGGMPSFQGRLTPEEIRAVVDYTRSL